MKVNVFDIWASQTWFCIVIKNSNWKNSWLWQYLWYSFKVPGRLGLLITLDLIATNTYNSVKAPSGRGFSYIEIWLIGIQIPILLAIFEYGILLTIKRISKQEVAQTKIHVISSGTETQIRSRKLRDMDQIGKTMDKWTFFGSLCFMIIFNIVYWCVAPAELDKYNWFCTYRKVPSSSMSWLVAHFQIFRSLMKGKFDVNVLWPLA